MVESPALQGVRILDLTHMLSGPYATMLLGDLGADVVKVESPRRPDRARSVPPWRVGDQSAYFLSLNRNKRSVTLDLTEPGDRERFLDLVKTADVVFENFRPGVGKRLGIDRAALEERNPHVIVCSLSGFGQTGPWRARPAYDYLIQALAGTMSLTGEPDGPPTKYGVSIVDHVGGLFAVIGILSALMARARDGGGRTIDVSLFDSHLSLLSYLAGWHLNCGAVPTRQSASAHPTLVPSQVFETRDGHLVIMVLADHFWRPMCDALELPELGDDPRFADATQRLTHRDELVPIIEARLRDRPTQHWLDALVKAGVPSAHVQPVYEALEGEQVQARDMILELQHAHYGSYKAIGNPLKISGSGPPCARPAPLLGEHTEELLNEVSVSGGAAQAGDVSPGGKARPVSESVTVPKELQERCQASGLDIAMRGGALELFIDRPERRNVLNPELVHCLIDALDWATHSESLRCVLLGGRGDAFCAGYDIGTIGSNGEQGSERDLVDRLATHIENLPIPVVAAVHGAAIGGGCDLAAACDIRLGSTTARFGMPPARLGVLYAVNGMRRLVQRAGDSTARDMLLTGIPIDARRAEQATLLSTVIEPEELLERARAVCDQLVANAPLSVAGSKRSLGLLSVAHTWTDAERNELEEIQKRVWASTDASEGPLAFRERRTPHFLGR